MVTNHTASFPSLLKIWREKNHMSQLDLALACDISQKHISYIETERSQPSQNLVLRFGEELGIPLRLRNQLLLAAGFAPAFPETDLSEPELAAIEQALCLTLDHHDPFPALVLDGGFNILRSNPGALKLMLHFFGVQDPRDLPDYSCNVMRGLFHDEGMWRRILNWNEIAPFLIQQLDEEIMHYGRPRGLVDLQAELKGYEAYSSVINLPSIHKLLARKPVMTTQFQLDDGLVLELFSTITTLGIAHDVALEELRIECFFPANEQSRLFFNDEA